jgi:hypothetical protein
VCRSFVNGEIAKNKNRTNLCILPVGIINHRHDVCGVITRDSLTHSSVISHLDGFFFDSVESSVWVTQSNTRAGSRSSGRRSEQDGVK